MACVAVSYWRWALIIWTVDSSGVTFPISSWPVDTPPSVGVTVPPGPAA